MKRYKSPHPLPTPREREILHILIEECSEVQKAATKILRFGAGDSEPGASVDNAWRLSAEVGDIRGAVKMLQAMGLVTNDSSLECLAARKIEKIEQHLQSEPD